MRGAWPSSPRWSSERLGSATPHPRTREERRGAGVVGGGQQLEAEAQPAAGLVLGDAEVGRGLAVVAALEVGAFQRGAQRGRHGLDDVVGAGGDGGVPDLAFQFLGGAVAVGQRGGLGGAQALYGEAVGQARHPGAQGSLFRVVGAGAFPDVGEDLAGDPVGRASVAEDAVGEAVDEGGETVVQLAEGGRLASDEPLLHRAVPAGWCVLLRHRAPSPRVGAGSGPDSSVRPPSSRM
ncbi:hypothetical protein SGLAM104S_07735 [Streptomyces glaucescens]